MSSALPHAWASLSHAGTLRLDGTRAADHITVTLVGDDLLVSRGQRSFRVAAAAVKALSVNLQGGNDFFRCGLPLAMRISGGDGRDVIRTGNGRDYVSGGAGNDDIRTNAGADTVVGGEGADTIYSGDGADHLHGGGGNDNLHGEDDDDAVYGDDGNDLLDGGRGHNKTLGGRGHNMFAAKLLTFTTGPASGSGVLSITGSCGTSAYQISRDGSDIVLVINSQPLTITVSSGVDSGATA